MQAGLCHIVQFAPGVCHIETRPVFDSDQVRGTPWLKDGLLLRPVFDERGQPIYALAHSRAAAIALVVQQLEPRLGPPLAEAQPCMDPEHIHVRSMPLRWSEPLPRARRWPRAS